MFDHLAHVLSFQFQRWARAGFGFSPLALQFRRFISSTNLQNSHAKPATFRWIMCVCDNNFQIRNGSPWEPAAQLPSCQPSSCRRLNIFFQRASLKIVCGLEWVVGPLNGLLIAYVDHISWFLWIDHMPHDEPAEVKYPQYCWVKICFDPKWDVKSYSSSFDMAVWCVYTSAA